MKASVGTGGFFVYSPYEPDTFASRLCLRVRDRDRSGRRANWLVECDGEPSIDLLDRDGKILGINQLSRVRACHGLVVWDGAWAERSAGREGVYSIGLAGMDPELVQHCGMAAAMVK